MSEEYPSEPSKSDSVHPEGEASGPRKARTARSRVSRFFRIIGSIILGSFILSFALVGSLRWIPPCTSTVMIEDQIARVFSGKREPAIRYQWVDWDEISPNMKLAAVAAEDQLFPYHRGFDIESIRQALEKQRRGGRLRGASTISQQVAKNLFLWTGRSYVRKALEAYFTILLEAFWPKKRILEVYLNIVEFGDGIYGVQAAAESFFRKSPAKLTRREAALLAAVLPNPQRYKVNRPSSYVQERRYWIEQQMEQLGGAAYLKDL